MIKETQAYDQGTYIFDNKNSQNINYHQTNQLEQQFSPGGNFTFGVQVAMSGDIFYYYN